MGNSCNSKSSEYEKKSNDDIILQSKQQYISTIHDGAILNTSCSYNENNNNFYIGTCSDDKRIAILKKDETNIYKLDYYLVGHEKAVNKIVMNNNILWSGSRDLTLRQWNIDNKVENKCIQTIANAHELTIAAVATSKDNKTVYSGSRDYTVKVWDCEKGLCKEEYKVPRNIVTSLEIGNDNLLYQGAEDLCVRVWDSRTASKQPAIHITGFIYFPVSLSLNEDERLLATGCKGFDGVGCEVKLWDLRNTSKIITEYLGHTHDVTGCKFTNYKYLSGNCTNQYDTLISISKDGSIISWDYKNDVNNKNENENNKTTNNIAIQKEGKYYTSLSLLSIDENGLQLVISSFDGTLSFKKYKNNNNKFDFYDEN